MKKLFSIILAISTALMFTGCDTTSSLKLAGENSSSTHYTSTIFDTSYVHEINVEISEEDWSDLLENPLNKTKYSTTVTIDGTKLSEVSFATKGNTSLSQIANTDSDRYSFKLNFDKFVEGQTYHGLDKLNLNNTYSDASYLKDYISYRTMAEAGVDAPLVSFVALHINGEYVGLYLAVEEVGDSFLERNYGENAGELYKPESEQFAKMDAVGGNRGNMHPFDKTDEVQNQLDGQSSATPNTSGDAKLSEFENGEMPDLENGNFPMPGDKNFTPPENGEFVEQADKRLQGGFGGVSNGADLVYTDDEIASYSDIFNNSETASTEEDYQRVIKALKQLSTGEDLDNAIDVESVLRYFVAHNFVVNYDSYTGNMLHNYFLYEEDGILSILPWDYNLSFGGFNGVDAMDTVNLPIDTPLASNVSEEERPLWTKLASNETYLDMYHEYFDDLISNYFESGRFEKEVDEIYDMIRPYVETDPTAFYSIDEFDTAVNTLKNIVFLRTKSVRGQLDGTIPSTKDGQSEDSSNLIDASLINLNELGGMNMNKGDGKMPGVRRNESQNQ